MTNKLHTSQKTQEIFNSLGQSLRLQPFILSKLAIALSVRKGQLQAHHELHGLSEQIELAIHLQL